MQTLAYVLGAAEILLVPVSLCWLGMAVLSPSRIGVRPALIVAAATALTVAQPFGLVAVRKTAPPSGARLVSPTGIHIARVGGVVPLVPFALYRQNVFFTSDTAATARLKARSWFWLPILTNGATVSSLCAQDVTVPCWTPGESNANTLELRQKDGRYYVTLRTPLGPRYLRPSSYTWELVPGIASVAGAIYWAALLVLVPLAVNRNRRVISSRGRN